MSLRAQVLLSVLILSLAFGVWTERERALALWTQATGGDIAAVEVEKSTTFRPVPVIVAPVVEALDADRIEAVGTGRAQRSVMLRPEVEGKIAAMALVPGRPFAEGDVMVMLDDAQETLALELAEIRLAEAERVQGRYQRLQGSGAATTATLSEVETAAQVARIELAKAAEALRRRSIVAPFDGVVGIPAVEIGDWVDEDVEIAPFDDRSKILVEVEIPERFLGRLAVGHKATVRMPAFPRRVFEGQVAALDSRVDPVSRTLKLRVAVANEDDLLRPGGSFRVGLRLEGERYPAVPELALQFQRGGSYIWRVADGQAEQVPVDLVRRGRGLVLVDGALRVGDQVVVEGVQRLRPARAVEVLETLAPLRSPTGDTVVAGEERGGAPVSPAAARTGGG